MTKKRDVNLGSGGSYTFIDNSDEILSRMDSAMDKTLLEIGNRAVEYAQKNLTDFPRVRTGRLRASIFFTTGGKMSGMTRTYQGESLQGTPSDVFGQYASVSNATLTGTVKTGRGGVKIGTLATTVEYAPYVEYGTFKMAPCHFMRDAVRDHRDEYKQIFWNHIKESLWHW